MSPERSNPDSETASRALDELLVLRAQSGDSDAFDRLFRRWNPRLLAYAGMHSARRSDPADAVQETWIAAVRALPRLRDPAAFPAVLFTTLRRRCADTMRARDRAGELSEEVPAAEAAGAGADEDAMGAAVRRLDPATRDLIHLRYTADLAVDEIAQVLNIPAGTVKSRLHAARAELKATFERTKRAEQSRT